MYDQLADRWILTQFTTRGLDDVLPFYNCVAISTTGDPTGSYYRYAFTTGLNFPDYPKYGVWTDSYVLTTREFGPTVEYGIGVYALEKNKMINGDPGARSVSFFLDGNDPVLLPLVGDGLLPADIDGKQKPPTERRRSRSSGRRTTSWRLRRDIRRAEHLGSRREVERSTPAASLELATQLPVAPFDSVFPCAPDSPATACRSRASPTRPVPRHPVLPAAADLAAGLPQLQGLRVAGDEPVGRGAAGRRRRALVRDPARRTGTYSLYQQGTYAPADGVHRWMGTIAQDKKGNMALGYSVVNGIDVYPRHPLHRAGWPATRSGR